MATIDQIRLVTDQGDNRRAYDAVRPRSFWVAVAMREAIARGMVQ